MDTGKYITSNSNKIHPYEAEESTPLLFNNSINKEKHAAEGKTSLPGAVFIVVNACIGAGLLNFPHAFQSAGGIVVGIVVQLLLLMVIICSLLVLAKCSHIHQSSTYQDVVHKMCGKIGLFICNITILFYCFGTCITFTIIIGDQLDSFLEFIDSDYLGKWYMNRKFTLTIFSTIIVLPLCIPKAIDFLKYSSGIGVLGSLYVCAIIVIKYFINGPADNIHVATSPDNWQDVFIAVPAICFGFQCHISSIPVYASLKKRTVGHFSKVCVLALFLAFIVYTFTAVFGSLTFGTSSCSDILKSYDADDISVTIARIMIGASVLTAYPILHFCGRVVVNDLYIKFFKLTPVQIESGERIRRIVQTTIWFVLALLLALFIPNIGVVISVIGGLAAVFIFIFPALLLIEYAMVYHEGSVRWKRFLIVCGIACVGLGTFILGESITLSIMDDIQGIKLTC